jgi:hypothetical protein
LKPRGLRLGNKMAVRRLVTPATRQYCPFTDLLMLDSIAKIGICTSRSLLPSCCLICFGICDLLREKPVEWNSIDGVSDVSDVLLRLYQFTWQSDQENGIQKNIGRTIEVCYTTKRHSNFYIGRYAQLYMGEREGPKHMEV